MAERILWVEDDDVFYRKHIERLKKEGFEIKQIRIGGEALRELEERGQDYDLIILDIILPPGRDSAFPEEILDEERGIELLRMLDERGVTKLPPILLLTAKQLEISLEEIRKELPYRFVGMLGKPIVVDEVLKEVKKHVQTSGGAVSLC